MYWTQYVGCIGHNMLNMEPPGRRQSGRPQRRFKDVVEGGRAERWCDTRGY